MLAPFTPYKETPMPVFNYSRAGDPIGDHEAESAALTACRTYDREQELVTSSICVVRAAQVLVAEALARDEDAPVPPHGITAAQAKRVRFAFEDDHIETDVFGRLKEMPLGFVDFDVPRYERFKDAVAQQIFGMLSKAQVEKIRELQQAWFEEEIQTIFSVGSKFWFSPRQPGLDALPDFTSAVEATAAEWGAMEGGLPALKTDVGIIALPMLLACAYDGTGGRMVSKVFSLAGAMRQLGMNITTLENPGWIVSSRIAAEAAV